MAERIPGSYLIRMVNDYFEITVGEIQQNGGHILKFMGDGLLAMFGHDDMTEAADAALDTVAKLRADIDRHNEERERGGLPATEASFALHAGEILYGNIGAENRLDFTAIGPAVNLTARLSGMRRPLGQNVILSEKVKRLATPGRHDLVSLGRYMLRGVAEPHELFTIYQPV
ncbi:adenylate/guanylate cyclase domain-containing protein [Jhaorihella thermophila]